MGSIMCIQGTKGSITTSDKVSHMAGPGNTWGQQDHIGWLIAIPYNVISLSI
jgi:hypothetical protein